MIFHINVHFKTTDWVNVWKSLSNLKIYYEGNDELDEANLDPKSRWLSTIISRCFGAGTDRLTRLNLWQLARHFSRFSHLLFWEIALNPLPAFRLLLFKASHLSACSKLSVYDCPVERIASDRRGVLGCLWGRKALVAAVVPGLTVLWALIVLSSWKFWTKWKA